MIKQRAFSLMEILVVIAILAIIGGMAINSLFGINRREALAKESANLASVLMDARALTLASKDSYQYGVHLAATAVTLFRGATYNAAATTNQVVVLNPLVVILNQSLTGGGNDIIFDRLTGATGQSGTITLALAADAIATKTVTVSPTGVVETN